MRRTTMPLEDELRGVTNAIRTLSKGQGPVWLLPSLQRRRLALQRLLRRKRR